MPGPAVLEQKILVTAAAILVHAFHVIVVSWLQAGLEHYEVLDVMAVEQALATLMRRCAALPEQAPPPGDSAKAAPKSSPSEPIIPADMKLPRCAQKAGWTLKHPL